MKTKKVLKKKPAIKENGSFSEFFRTASPEEMIKVITRAAEMANEDQRKTLEI
jgi:hypothetical protein